MQVLSFDSQDSNILKQGWLLEISRDAARILGKGEGGIAKQHTQKFYTGTTPTN